MKRFFPWLARVAFGSIPLWLHDPYLLNAFITTGIFTIAAMSLNLLLGYTGQLSLGHVAFFGIGAYASTKQVANRLRSEMHRNSNDLRMTSMATESLA